MDKRHPPGFAGEHAVEVGDQLAHDVGGLEVVFTLDFLIFSCISPSIGFDSFHISLSKFFDISISFLFLTNIGSCLVEDFIFPLCKVLSLAFESTLSDRCAFENPSDIFKSFADFNCILSYFLCL